MCLTDYTGSIFLIPTTDDGKFVRALYEKFPVNTSVAFRNFIPSKMNSQIREYDFLPIATKNLYGIR